MEEQNKKVRVTTENTRYLVIDIEKKGQHTYQDMLCFAAVIGNMLTGEIEETFKVYIKSSAGTSNNWEKRCLDEFWNKPENINMKNEIISKIEKEGVTCDVAAMQLYEWINHNRTQEFLDSVIIMTDTAGFDIGCMNDLLSSANLLTNNEKIVTMNYLVGGDYKPIIDLHSFHLGVAMKLPMMGVWGAEKAACDKLGINYDDLVKMNPHKSTHDPLDDAKTICWEAMRIHKVILGLLQGPSIEKAEQLNTNNDTDNKE
jgi:hypothetical protein